MFLTDGQGNELSEDTIHGIEITAKACWIQMAHANYAPYHWQNVAQVPADYFCNTMQAAHPEFSYADGPWKCRAYGILHYSSWRADYLPGSLINEDTAHLGQCTSIAYLINKTNVLRRDH